MKIGSVLVTGANRGLGLEFVRQFLALPTPPEHVISACRNPDGAKDLHDLKNKHKNLSIVKIDLNDTEHLEEAVKEVEATLGNSGLNLLINNAGIASRDNLDTITAEEMMRHFRVNAVGPLMVTKLFLPLLRKAAGSGGEGASINQATVCSISSGVGSIGENDSGGAYAYRTSKAGLNMITKNMSIDLKKDGIIVVSIHPGWLKTDMGGPNATMEADVMAKKIIDLMGTFTSDEFTGKLYHFSGRVMQF